MAKEAKDAAAMDVAVVATPDKPPYELSTQYQIEQTLILVAFLVGVFYFLLIRPEQKRLKAHRTMLESMKKGSRIITGGGVHGVVVKHDGDDVVHVEIAPNVRVKVHKHSISEVLDEGKPTANTANDN